MKKLLLLIIILTVVGGAGAQDKVFEPIYWFYGRILPAADPLVASPNGRLVMTYYRGAVPDTDCATDEVGPMGASSREAEYVINLMSDPRNTPVENTTYEVATIRGADGYGAGPVTVTIDGTGVKMIPDMRLVLGGGVVPGEPPPAGTVRLTISRVADTVGSDVRVSWPGPEPNIYVLTGGGTGVYTNEVSAWNWIDPLNLTDEYDFYSGYMIHLGQVGAGVREVYYKALIAGLDPRLYLASAEAVGKFDIPLLGTPGVNQVNITLSPADTNPNAVIGTQLNAGSTIWSWTGAGYNSGYFSGIWSTGVASVVPNEGYWIITPTGRRLTIVGSVLNADQNIALGDKNVYMFGNSYAAPNPLTASQLSTVFNTGDSVWRWTNTASGGYDSVYYMGANTWSAAFDKLAPARGFWILRASRTPITWVHPKPY